ncbi:PiggyBac transposable element-derived protein 1 [Elysia marginata]|uniref:PiggyBac transposable element-derived protein 1 n=1 Tax=Elysia marginata TaxID=1093978 RepID=A0AAV4FP74_9GAST|nr:PiggyBac transposable element-derived protein 1 [Elysia marginata]
MFLLMSHEDRLRLRTCCARTVPSPATRKNRATVIQWKKHRRIILAAMIRLWFSDCNPDALFLYRCWAGYGPGAAYTDGYLVQTEPYQGAGTVLTQPDLSIEGSVMMDLISVLPEEDKYCLYFDNLFTSPAIKDKGYDATGTLPANCLNQCPLEGVDNMKKMKRGSIDHRLNHDKNIISLHWNDNSVVTLCSTKHGISPLKNVQRFSQ